MRKPPLYFAAAVLLAGCSDGTASSVATSISVSPRDVSMDAVGLTQVVRATVTDQNGKAMSGPSLAWSSSSSAVTVASAGGDSAIVTSVSNGQASITARSGEANGSMTVQVSQAAASLAKQGDEQSGGVGAPLPSPLRVLVRDRRGNPMPGATVAFQVTAGGGSVSPAAAVSGPDGFATGVWTLGTEVGAPQQATATIGSLTMPFTATAVAGPPATATAVAGDGQTAGTGRAVAVPPQVLIEDAFGNPVAGVTVVFSVSAGGGTLGGATQTTNESGIATVGSWFLGSAQGVNTLTATLPGTGLANIVFTARAAAPGDVSRQAGDNQAGLAGDPVPTRPRVQVRDGSGNPVPGVAVTFTASGGGGRVEGGAVTTDANGMATVGAWILGPQAMANTLTATISDLAAAPAVFTAVGCSPGGAGYTMTLCFTTPITASQRTAFEGAVARWSAVIKGDLPNLTANIPAGSCGSTSPELDFEIDDLVIFAGVEPIDGPGAVLGQAGWCYRRSAGLPLVGLMRFDAADVAALESTNRFVAVVLHEMGHVLGLSAGLWSTMGFLKNPSGSTAQDTYFDGPRAIAGFDQIGGSSYTGGSKVPVENTGGGGTANSHWRETVLVNELMTGYLNSGSNPLSVLTVGALADMGYVVDSSAADPFSLTLSARQGADTVLHLRNDEYNGPRYTVDRSGRRSRIPR